MPLLARLTMSAVVLLASTFAALAETSEVRITKQPGLLYLPMILMEEGKLIEKHAKAAGLGDVKASWITFNSGGAATDALLSGNVDFVTSGASNMLLLWDRTKGQVKGVAACGGMPMYLVTKNPAIKSLKDFTEKDKIAVPTIKVSSQATILQMAAEKEFGPGQHGKLDSITLQLGHPDATLAILSPVSEISSHFSLPPYQNIALKDPAVHKVLSSLDVFGGPVNNAIVFSTAKFHDANPKIIGAVIAAMTEAMARIKSDPKGSIDIYLSQVKEKLSAAELVALLKEPGVVFEVAPVGMQKFATFMARVGTLKTTPASWKDFFFAEAHGLPGN
jgi:NitT/TauT family transport system substrate-binding protein